MRIYHGSDVVVKIPKILTANRLLDFGEGFYTTSNYEQAEAQQWKKKKPRCGSTAQKSYLTSI